MYVYIKECMCTGSENWSVISTYGHQQHLVTHELKKGKDYSAVPGTCSTAPQTDREVSEPNPDCYWSALNLTKDNTHFSTPVASRISLTNHIPTSPDTDILLPVSCCPYQLFPSAIPISANLTTPTALVPMASHASHSLLPSKPPSSGVNLPCTYTRPYWNMCCLKLHNSFTHRNIFKAGAEILGEGYAPPHFKVGNS